MVVNHLSESDISPVISHLIVASFAALSPGQLGRFPWWQVGVIAIWGAAGFAVALRNLRWDSRHS